MKAFFEGDILWLLLNYTDGASIVAHSKVLKSPGARGRPVLQALEQGRHRQLYFDVSEAGCREDNFVKAGPMRNT